MLHFTGRSTSELIHDMNKKLKGVNTLTLDANEEFCTYKVIIDGVFSVLSHPQMKRLEI